jgi:methyl-accepting chemotaxis protein
MKAAYLLILSILLGLLLIFIVIQSIDSALIYSCLFFLAALMIAYILLIKIFNSFTFIKRFWLSKLKVSPDDKPETTNVTFYTENIKQTENKLQETLLPANEKIYKIKSLIEESLAALNTYETNLPARESKTEPAPLAISHSQREEKKSYPQNLEQYFLKLKDDLSEIKENTAKVYSISDNITNSAETAMELSKNVKEGIITVTKSLTESLIHSEKLFAQSKKIGEILELISDIASKTNVLSINASIVSARVGGKDGQTFGVVAREIRALAAETEKSLSQIESVTKEIQQLISILAENIKISEGQTRKEMDTILQVAGSLQGIVLGMEVVRSVSVVINEKSTFQNEEINSSDRITQKLNIAREVINQNKDEFSHYLKQQASSLQEALSLLEEQLPCSH